MAKRTRTFRRLEAHSDSGEPKDLTTFSVRLTDEDRERVARAAALRGWSPTNLIRMATVDRVTDILNTSGQTSFKGLAIKVAEQLAKPRTYIVKFGHKYGTSENRITEPELADLLDPNSDVQVIGVIPVIEQLSREVLAEVSKAAKHGGVEFLRQIIEYAEGLAAPDRLDATKLIDPKAKD